MSVRHIVSSLRRNRLMPLLLVAQVAIACAILCNALFLLYQRVGPMLVPDGIAPGEVIGVDQIIASGRSWSRAEIERTTQALRAIPGVKFATPVMGIPLASSMQITGLVAGPDGTKTDVDVYMGDDMVDALGLQLVAGRNFTEADYEDGGMGIGDGKQRAAPTPVIITRALADRLYAHGQALGRPLTRVNDKDGPGEVVVGVVRHLLRYKMDAAADGRAENSVLVPTRITGSPLLSYAVRTDARARGRVIKAIPGVVKAQLGAGLMPGIDIQVRGYEDIRDGVFSSWRAAVWLLATVCVVVVIVTAVGIMGLTGYWVQQRTRQIGIRRALGARRRDILAYFLAENFLIVGAGVAFGMVLAYAINLFLMRHYELERLPCSSLPVGALALWVLGQLAVLGPARRAAAVPPVVATRSV